MSNRPARTAAVAALSDWRRHAAATAAVVAAFAVAAAVGGPGAYFGAALVAFTVWMAWFVLTTIAFRRRADF
jgi:hypothetical protein